MARTPSTHVISITPLTDDGALDEQRIRTHLRRFADAGIGAYIGGSGSGEGYTLDEGELSLLLEIAVDELKGKVPVRAMGAEPRHAEQLVKILRIAEKANVDAVQIYSLDAGHANLPNRAELDRYYDDVLSAVGVPAVISTHVSVGYVLPVDLIVGLTERYPHVVGVNCTSGDLTYVVNLVDALPEHVEIHLGGPMLAPTAFALGANGYLSSEANVAPKLCQSMVDAVVAGDLAGANAAYQRIMRLFTANMARNAVSAGRLECQLLGVPVGPPRLPRLPITDPAIVAELTQVLRDLDIAAIEGTPVSP